MLVISTDPGISTVDARVKGFEDAAAKDSAFNYVGVQYSHDDPATAAQLVTAALQKDPDIVGIFATNLFAAEGTATGVKQAGKGDQITIVGFDAGPNQVKALKDGTVQALVAQEPGDDRHRRPRPGGRRARRRHRDPEDPDRVHRHHRRQRRHLRRGVQVLLLTTTTRHRLRVPAGSPPPAGTRSPATPIVRVSIQPIIVSCCRR